MTGTGAAPQPSVTAGETGHVKALDGLRGIAILFVIAFHYVTACGYGADSSATRKIAGLASSLWSGVDLFFVLSGFLITGILLRAKGSRGYFKNFYVRRVLRIFPLYYGALVVLFIVLPRFVAFDTPGVRRIYDAQGWLWAYAENLAIVYHREDFFGVDWLWVGHFWSLAVEEHFYLVWPLIVFLCSRRALYRLSIAVIVATPLARFALLGAGMGAIPIFVLTLTRLDELVLGGLFALLMSEENGLELASRWGRRAGWVGGVYLVLVLLGRRQALAYEHWTMVGFGYTALAMVYGAALVRALVPGRTAWKRLLETRPLMTAGRYSYGAYVMHTPLQPVCMIFFPPARIAAAASGLGFTASHVIGLVGFAALGTGVAMTGAFASYHLFERHFLRLKRHFEYGA